MNELLRQEDYLGFIEPDLYGRELVNQVALKTLLLLKARAGFSTTPVGVMEILGHSGLSLEVVKELKSKGIHYGAVGADQREVDAQIHKLRSVEHKGVSRLDTTASYECDAEFVMMNGALMHENTADRRRIVNRALSQAGKAVFAINWDLSDPEALWPIPGEKNMRLVGDFKRLYFLSCGWLGANPFQGGENPYLFRKLQSQQVDVVRIKRPAGEYSAELQEVADIIHSELRGERGNSSLAYELESWLGEVEHQILFLVPPPLVITVGYVS